MLAYMVLDHLFAVALLDLITEPIAASQNVKAVAVRNKIVPMILIVLEVVAGRA